MNRAAPAPTAAPDGGPPIDPDARSGWETGTVIDMYTPIYLALAKPGADGRAPVPPDGVRGLDLTVVAALLGVGRDDWGDWAAEMRAGWQAAQARGETWMWGDD